MKATFRMTMMLLAGAGLLQSCTKVSEPYSVIKAIIVDTTKRTVLLEDYTGHLCVNCGPAAEKANTIQDLYKGQVFVMAVHAGPFAKPNPVSYPPYLLADFRCEAGNDWNGYSSFNIDGYPKGMVNRRLYNGKLSFGSSEWNEAVKVAVTLPKVARIKIQNTFDNQNKLLDSGVDVKFLLSYTGRINLTVCILEDSIYGGQLNNVKEYDSVPIIKNFRFMHVLRGSLNGSFGEEIATNPASNKEISKTYSVDFNAKSWVPEHCSVIAFITDADTKEILEVAKSPDLH
jgi:hypothetical protein